MPNAELEWKAGGAPRLIAPQPVPWKIKDDGLDSDEFFDDDTDEGFDDEEFDDEDLDDDYDDEDLDLDDDDDLDLDDDEEEL